MKVTVQNGVATVDFNRPQRANSLNEAGWRDLKTTFKQLGANDDVKVVILTGQGENFCAGMDLSVLAGLTDRVDSAAADVAGQFKKFITEIQGCITAIEQCGKPVIAAIQGGCIGGGVAIATACDIRYCTDSAYFVIKEVEFGIIADIGTLQRLPRIVGSSITMELALTGRPLGAERATSTGLVNATFSSRQAMLAHVTALATTIARNDRKVIQGIKSSVNYSAEHTLAEGLDHVARLSAENMARNIR